jgi:hypothetical protein
MTHLSESEFVDLAENEGSLDARRAAHVETCGACREQLTALRAMLRDAGSVEVPEPSPLFWEHMSNRVRAELAAEPLPVRSGWSWIGLRGLMPLAAVAALIVAVISGLLLVRTVRIGNPASPGNQAPPAVDQMASVMVLPVPARPETTPDADNAEVWAVLTAAASDLALEDARAAGMHVLPAAIDYAVQDLSEAELAELGRLLQSELKRSSN